MTINRNLRALATGVLLSGSVFVAVAQQKMPETTRTTIPGSTSVVSETLRGTVEYVEGNHLVVRMANGDIRSFDPPADRRFLIDGQSLTARELKPGTRLVATVSTTTTSVTERTRTVGTAKVFWVNGRNVILTLPNGENRSYKVEDHYRFTVDGQSADVSQLRRGMTIAAEKITEQPRSEIVFTTTVVGQAPPPTAPKAIVAQAPPPPVPAPRTELAQAPPTPVPPPVRAPEPVQIAQAQAPIPQELPATASQLPLLLMAGLVLTISGLGMRRTGRQRTT